MELLHNVFEELNTLDENTTAVTEDVNNNKHVIWSNMELDLDDWREDLESQYPEAIGDEEELFNLMVDINDADLDDERANLSGISYSDGIVVFADIGRWNGRFDGYKIIESGEVSDCLTTDCDYAEWFIEDGEFKYKGAHHDGENYYTYRAITDREEFDNAIESEMNFDEIKEKYTKSIAPDIAKVYGWSI